jgi:anaerobic magnesium-protoporphyrin IX monomethyl ester cyclase
MKIDDNGENYDVLLVGYEEQENIGLRSIAAYLMKHQVKVKIIPYDALSKEKILIIIRAGNPKIVGFSLIFQRMLFQFGELISYLRQNGITTHFTMGGHYPSIEPKVTLVSIAGLDSVVRGEGEETLLELLHHYNQPETWIQIKGIAYRKNGEIIVTSPRPLIQDLDSLPFPIRWNNPITIRGLGICSILASRGCYYNCSFCSVQQFYKELPGPKRRSRSPSNVVHEMEQEFYKRGVRIFIFEDDDFLTKGQLQRQWYDNFVAELKKTKIANQILWRISCRIDDLDAELIKKMMEVGLICVYLGIESGNNEGLKIYNKHYTVDDVSRALDILRDIRMPFEFGFMILNPDSTFAMLKQDIAFLKEIGQDGKTVVNFTKMVPYTGTAIANKLQMEERLEGTIDSPDYSYKDTKLDLLQLFFNQAFHIRNFDKSGLVERLRYAKFDAIVCNKLFPNKFNTQFYSETLQNLIYQSNTQCVEKVSLAVNFMEKQNEEKIIDNWFFLENLVQEEKRIEFDITQSLNWLMNYYS